MDAAKAVKDIYSFEDLKEIADHGCQSGVCHKHIYYGDTVQFYETFETNILDELILEFSPEFLVDLFRDADADLTYYKNAVVWSFIETIANDVVEEEEIRGYQLKQLVEAV